MRRTVSLRSQASGTLTDLLHDEGLECQASQSLICHLAADLVDYREEGVGLNPTVLFCENADALVEALPAARLHLIGSAALSAASVAQILKECAPLSSANWILLIERADAQSVRYGVLNYLQTPTAPGLVEVIAFAAKSPAFVVRRIARSTIEVAGARGHSRVLVFSTSREDAEQPTDDVLAFAKDCCGAPPAGIPLEGFANYFYRVLQRTLERSHGSILVCDASGGIQGVEGAKDAIMFADPVNFAADFAEYKSTNSAEAMLKLQRSEELLQGLVNSDGIVLFDAGGAVTGYRMFYSPPQPVGPVVGGARRRAFEGVRALVGNVILSTLFRSQDGTTLYVGAAE
jgi:hypothetical protein